MRTLEQTTASVDALPTSTEPPSTVYPKNELTEEMMKAKNRLLMILMYINQGLNDCCNPWVKSSGVKMWPLYAVPYAPKMPVADEKITKNGMMVIKPSIFGRMR